MNLATYRVLAALGDREQTAPDILAAIQGQGDSAGVPSLASFYRHLKRAADAGWLEIVGGDPQGTPGRPGQLYRLTRAGRTAVRAEAGRLRDLAALGEPAAQRGRR